MAPASMGVVHPLPGANAPRAAPKKVLTPHNRFFWWFSLSLLFLGPFGFLVGPLMARRGLRKAERLYPGAAYMARQRDQGFTWAQWWVMTPLVLTMGMAAMAVLKWLPMALIVMCS
ncbi:hypothetical protein QN244_11910 [Xanthomonas rydalmerensis]|uniref:Uncharacterized protein n=2 Tax=Xanthomonas rydalmerensis TaxID=3046274 RepID=A0ABZ0JSZ2_9XANT|nr:hypothetical protein [Xanthomonas sp. DM-2023]WOS42984.1 hypothetical protein QN243_11910 [Xanthomonas sp. DM-2023]WOS47167.1 hypothetical protein QN242_11910 [Xanthomonas sp. DM-2023]WOS51347.1 hypothetical protein QN240_11910 [Xanthomonas sp. DM-2023]WOS55529.1 hypothetical protein QN244_11910 [Xanthomonas sp. DM-2023]WOS59711.1 hypothetical protein QN245_11910 [Xanthomonas sp. DM-2023]